MSTHCGYIVEVKELRPHSNADRLQIATFFGNDTCVGLDVQIGNKGIYFPSDIQLSEEFATVNNLVRKKDDAGNNIGGYKIDLALKDKMNKKYVLGIECDGKLYRSPMVARERDIFRQKYLESRGWTICRIWSNNWWHNPQKEIENILKIYNSLTE